AGNRWPATPGELAGAEWGPLLTLPEMVGDPEEKRRLAAEHGAIAVDMESAFTARLCHERRVPFAALRALSDDVNTSLSPRLLGLLRGGKATTRRVALVVLKGPVIVPELWRLARDTRVAARRLAEGLA